jgi:hypothetical protein
MKKYISILLLLSIALFINACDKIEAPYKNTGDDDGEPIITSRKVLLEEYTGHNCVKCPTASKLAEELKALYGDRLIILNIHAGILAAPVAAPFDTDFRSVVGNQWDAFFAVSSTGLPLGIINRVSSNGIYFSTSGNWSSKIETALEAENFAKIDIQTDYDATIRKLDINLETSFQIIADGDFKLQVVLVEDNIIAAQKNDNQLIGPATITDYNHRHVLRASANGPWGENLVANGGTVEADVIYEHTYSIILNEGWDASQISVIAFVYEDESKEIFQVEEVKIN